MKGDPNISCRKDAKPCDISEFFGGDHYIKKSQSTLPETNMFAENRPGPKKETHLPTPVFQVQAVSFRQGSHFHPTFENTSSCSSAHRNVQSPSDIL